MHNSTIRTGLLSELYNTRWSSDSSLMNTVLTVIVDNTPSPGLSGEWGLSVLAEHRGHIILADTGSSDLLAINMKKMGFDIKDVDYGVLSHAHNDHAGGLSVFFNENRKAQFYFRESTAENCYKRKFVFHKYIGIPKHVTEDYCHRIEFVFGDYELYEGAYLIPHKMNGLDQTGRREKMYRRIDDGWVPDDFSHEQSLVLETNKGLVIINSCSHGGAVNIINEIKSTFPDKHIYGLIGGFHLYNKSKEEVHLVGKQLRDTEIDYICTGHCTGEMAYSVLKKELGDRLEQLRVGLKIVI